MNSKRLAKEGLVLIDSGEFENEHHVIVVKAFYNSSEQLDIPYEKAKTFLENQKMWRKFNMGKKLSVVRG